jgi:hypothetical protein
MFLIKGCICWWKESWIYGKFDTELKSLKFQHEIMTLVSLANNIGSDAEVIHKGVNLCMYYEQ